jgi:hypothetical protein
VSTTTFSAASAVKRRADNTFAIDISSQWTAGGLPNGGYLLSTIARAAGEVSRHPHVVSASANYFSSPQPGAATVEIELLHDARTVSTFRGRLVQNAKTCVEATCTFGELAAEPRTFWQGGVPEIPSANPAAGIRVPAVSPSGVAVPLNGEVDIRLDRGTAPFHGPSGRGELRAWLALPNDESFCPASLLFAVDAVPPATFDVIATPYVPTMTLTTYVRALPAPGPVRVLVRAHLLAENRCDQSCHVWDRAGRLVAHATSLGTIRLPRA